MKTNTNTMAECPSCGETIHFDRYPRLNQLIDCRYCREELEVIDLEPLLLDWPFEEGDFDDDYDDDDDDDDW